MLYILAKLADQKAETIAVFWTMVEILKYKTSNSKYVKAIYSDKINFWMEKRWNTHLKTGNISYFLIHLMIPVRNIIPDFLYLLKIWDVMNLYYTLGDFLVIISSLSPLYKSILHRENTGLISWIFSTNSATKIYFSFLSSCHIKVNKHCPDWIKKLLL